MSQVANPGTVITLKVDEAWTDAEVGRYPRQQIQPGAPMRDLNHYRAPSRVWEWVEHNWLIQAAIIVGIVAMVAAQWR